MALGRVNRVGFLIRLQIRVDELDETVEVFRRDGFILLVKVVDVAAENLDKEFHRDGRVHACIGDAQSTLQTLKHALAIAIQLHM